MSLPEPEAPGGTGRWLLMRRSIGDPTELAYYLAYGPKETPTEELIRVAGRRWTIEDCLEQAKGRWAWMSMRSGSGRPGTGT